MEWKVVRMVSVGRRRKEGDGGCVKAVTCSPTNAKETGRGISQHTHRNCYHDLWNFIDRFGSHDPVA